MDMSRTLLTISVIFFCYLIRKVACATINTAIVMIIKLIPCFKPPIINQINATAVLISKIAVSIEYVEIIARHIDNILLLFNSNSRTTIKL